MNHTLRISPRLFALVPAAVAINLVVGTIVKELSLPVFLDTVGTVLVAVLAGWRAGALVGTVSQLLLGLLTGYQYLPFVVIQWLLSMLASLAANRHGFSKLWRTVLWGIGAGACCGAVSSVISYYFFGGITGGGVSWVVTGLRSLGASQPMAVFVGSSSTDILDKGIVIVVVGFVLRSLPRRILGRFPMAARAVGK